ncbi:Quinone oxidoreductase [Klebsiella variicola]|uniref:Quinone oxidoreductase n=1 Tax=Klebsiella variicola TaxID=244366 RepID=A0A7H4MI91_KLEVA|nr:Quinone oxidoreductase [Klebsiella variicola]
MAQQAPVALQSCLPVPDALDDVSAAAMANPGMSAWASLVTRAQIQAGETVLINGATGSAGQLAVQIARYLGAKKIIATGRNAQTLAALDADECIHLTADDKTLSGPIFSDQPLRRLTWSSITCGDTARKCYCRPWRNIPQPADPVRYVQVGSLAGADIALNGAVLRSAPLVLMGSGIGSLSMPQLLAATGEMLQAAVPGKFTIATTPRPLQEIAAAWPRDDSQKRTVFTLG